MIGASTMAHVRFQLLADMSFNCMPENNFLASNLTCPVQQLLGQKFSLLSYSVVYCYLAVIRRTHRVYGYSRTY